MVRQLYTLVNLSEVDGWFTPISVLPETGLDDHQDVRTDLNALINIGLIEMEWRDGTKYYRLTQNGYDVVDLIDVEGMNSGNL